MLGSSWQHLRAWQAGPRRLMGQVGDAAEVGAQRRLWAAESFYGLSMWLGLPCNQPGGPKFLRPLSCLSPMRGQPRRSRWSLPTQPQIPEATRPPCSFGQRSLGPALVQSRDAHSAFWWGRVLKLTLATQNLPRCGRLSALVPTRAGWAPAYLPGHTPGSSRRMARWRRAWVKTWVRKTPWRRKWQPAPVSYSGESHGQRSLAGYSPRGHKESDTPK